MAGQERANAVDVGRKTGKMVCSPHSPQPVHRGDVFFGASQSRVALAVTVVLPRAKTGEKILIPSPYDIAKGNAVRQGLAAAASCLAARPW